MKKATLLLILAAIWACSTAEEMKPDCGWVTAQLRANGHTELNFTPGIDHVFVFWVTAQMNSDTNRVSTVCLAFKIEPGETLGVLTEAGDYCEITKPSDYAHR